MRVYILFFYCGFNYICGYIIFEDLMIFFYWYVNSCNIITYIRYVNRNCTQFRGSGQQRTPRKLVFNEYWRKPRINFQIDLRPYLLGIILAKWFFLLLPVFTWYQTLQIKLIVYFAFVKIDFTVCSLIKDPIKMIFINTQNWAKTRIEQLLTRFNNLKS